MLQERSNSGRIPAKLKLSCKQGGRDQPTRSYTLPFPHAPDSQLRATALGSVDPAITQSSAVHTLIPNLAPRSRLQQQGLNISSGSNRLSGGPDAVGAIKPLAQLQLPGAEDFGREADSSCQDAGKLLESGTHQAAREAIFQAAVGMLKPKLAEPVLVNFMSVAGMSLASACGVCCLLLLHVSCMPCSMLFAVYSPLACAIDHLVCCSVCRRICERH